MKRKQRLVLLMMVVLSCLFAAAAQAEIDISFREEELVVAVGKELKARYTVSPKGSSVAFESSDESIATVDYTGLVKGKAEGECTITITNKRDFSVTDTIPVRVVKAVKKVEASVESKKLAVGDTVQITYTLSPEDATLPEVEFISRNEEVVTVDEDGLITAVGRGATNVVVRSVDGNAQSTLKITVEQMPAEVTFKQPEYSINAGKSIKFLATVHPSDTNNKKLQWTSSDKSIATVDGNGKVTTKAIGDVVITATCVADPSVSGSVILHSVKPIKSISFEQTVFDTSVGGRIQLEPVILPEDASHTRLNYEVRNRQVCEVDENGLITTLRGGITTVTATATDGSDRSATVTVRSIVPLEGAYFEQESVRVEIGSHTFAYAKLRPLDATIKNMTWTSSNPNVATAYGEDNRVRIVGHSWGRCTITGTTEQGGFTCSIHVNVGALRSPMAIAGLQVTDGKAYVTLRNDSDMHMTGATLSLQNSDGTEAQVELDIDLAPGATAENLLVETPFAARHLSAAIAAWETDTGFYNNADELLYRYRISPGLQEWYSSR